MTILEKIQKNDNDCLHNPSLLSEYLVILASNIIEAENRKVATEIKYAKKWAEKRPSLGSDKMTDMTMKGENEYIELRAAEALSRTILETIRAMKKRLSFLQVEYSELTMK